MSLAILYMSMFPLFVVSLTGVICLPDSALVLGVFCVIAMLIAPVVVAVFWVTALVDQRQVVVRSSEDSDIEGWLLCHVFRIHRYLILDETGRNDKYKDRICRCCGVAKYAATKYNLREERDEKTSDELKEMHQAKMPKKLKDGLFVEAI